MSKLRANRIAEEIKRELSQIIRSELKDPRVSGIISITGVDVSGDLKYAKIYISHYGEKSQQEEVIQGLEKAAGFIRSELGKRIRLRVVPELIFKLDESMEYGNKISKLLFQIKDQENKNE